VRFIFAAAENAEWLGTPAATHIYGRLRAASSLRCSTYLKYASAARSSGARLGS
jgi:hypothetical protein